LRPDGFGAREIGGRCRAISAEAPHDCDFAPGEFVCGRGCPHTADEKADRVHEVGDVGIAHGDHADAGLRGLRDMAATDSKRQPNLQAYLASLTAKLGW
jgi:hypothetical protein